jgi:hypothetical protein
MAMTTSELPCLFQLGERVALRLDLSQMVQGEIRAVSFGLDASVPLYAVRFETGSLIQVAEDELVLWREKP